MNTRQTSIDCYNEIKASGLLSKKRFEVYEAILKNAPCTSAEAMVGNLNSTNVLSQSRARFTELRELGVIYEKSIRKCRVTSRNVIEWDLTDNLPKDIKLSKNTKKNRVDDCLKAFRKLYDNRHTSTVEQWRDTADLIKRI